MRTFFISSSTFCMERMLDAQKIAAYLKANEWIPIENPQQADLIIVSTCAFGEDEDQGSMDFIHYYLKKKKSSALFIIAGCISSINPQLIEGLQDVYVLTPTTIEKIDTIIHPCIPFDSIEEPNQIIPFEVKYQVLLKHYLMLRAYIQTLYRTYRNYSYILKELFKAAQKTMNEYMLVFKMRINPFLTSNRTKYYYLRVSKGCLGSCSYCAKRRSTGKLSSKRLNTIIDEFRKGLHAGYTQYYLLAEDTGCYGHDQGETIVTLLSKLFHAGRSFDYKIVISNCNAGWFVKYYSDLEPLIIEQGDKIIYLQIPIQSGSNRILTLMNRNYQIEEVSQCLLALREKKPSVNLVTDIIVGFPSETEDDYTRTKEFLKRIRFNHVDIFGYEKRPGTLAEKIGDDVPGGVIEGRIQDLSRLQDSIIKENMLPKKIIELIKEEARCHVRS